MAKRKEDEEIIEEWTDDEEGQLAIDAYQDEDNIVLKAPVAGVAVDDLEISITDEVVTIKGQRKGDATVQRENYFVQECYWGGFSRSYILPMSIDASKAQASLSNNGILTIVLPKQEKVKTRVIKVDIS